MDDAEFPMITKARTILHEWVESDSLRKHCEAVSASMRYFAKMTGADEDRWGAVGILHDMDYERHPNLELSETGHPFVGVRYLRENGWDEEILRAILSHADYSGVEPETSMEKVLCAVDELSGFVMACALVRPDKSLFGVEVSSVKKKLKDKAFAAKVSREDIAKGADRLDMPMDDLIAAVIAGERVQAARLGLAGTA